MINNRQQRNINDVEQVRRLYRASLSELTFNSKPIITNLTIMAQENQHAASVIVREIENQLRNNMPGQKLPVLYLIDSICKNVGHVYITHFARNMVNNYLDAYTLSDPTVRKSFERLLQTWKNGMPGGQPVFSRHVIESIERSIHYIREKTPTSRYPHAATHQNPSIHVNPNFLKDASPIRDPRTTRSPQIPENTLPSSTLLTQLQALLPPQSNNYSLNDPVTQIISQIKSILPTLPPTQAASIEQYLAQINTASPTIPVAAAQITTPQLGTPQLSTPQLNMPSLGTPQLSTPQLSTPQLGTPQLGTPPLSVPRVATPSPTLSNARFINSPQVDTANLLKSLSSMGYLQPPEVVTLDSFGPFLLDSKDLQTPRAGAVELLYSAEPLQCKQCGFRYPKTEKGQAKMDAHLDSHFRQNRKMKERTKRGLSRSWFVTVDEWISGEGGELTSQQAPAFLHDNAHPVQTTEQPMEDVITKENTVIMPDEAHRKPCPICGERFVDFWNDDEEEWMYKNAIMVDDKIYHATCYTDAVQSGALIQDVHNNLKRKINEQDKQVKKQPRLE